MPSVTITPARGSAITIQVDDKFDAVRIVSSRLVKVFTEKSVEKALNKWLSTAMRVPMPIGTGKDYMIIRYND